MTGSPAILRLTQDGAVMLHAGADGTSFAVRGLATSTAPCLDGAGRVASSAGPVAATLAEKIGASSVLVVLPPSAATLSRITVDLPSPGVVTGAVIEDGVGLARDAAAKENLAVLSCRPYAYGVGDVSLDEPPLRERLANLRVDVACLCAPLSVLSALEGALRPLELAGVITAPEALGAALLTGEGTAIRVGRHETIALQMRSGTITAQAHVPIGRRHLEGDLAQARALEPSEAARRTDAVLSGTSSDDIGIEAVFARLAEVSDLLRAAADQAGLSLEGAILSGLPPRAAARIAGASPSVGAGPPALADQPELAGAALLTLGLRGSLARAALPDPPMRSRLDWLMRRF